MERLTQKRLSNMKIAITITSDGPLNAGKNKLSTKLKPHPLITRLNILSALIIGLSLGTGVANSASNRHSFEFDGNELLKNKTFKGGAARIGNGFWEEWDPTDKWNKGYCGLFNQFRKIDIDGRSNRIAGGFKAEEGDFPSYVRVSVREANGVRFCGGVILSNELILTSAHCFGYSNQDRYLPPKTVFVNPTLIQPTLQDALSYGSTDDTPPYEAAKICVSSNYVHSTIDQPAHYDFAILRLKQHIIYQKHVQPICFPTQDYSEDSTKFFKTVGLGHNQQYLLGLKVYPTPCEHNAQFGRSCFATFGAGTPCKGDSGGPTLTVVGDQQILVSIVASGYAQCTANASEPYSSFNVYKLRRTINVLMSRCRR